MAATTRPQLASLQELAASHARVFDAVDSLREAGLDRELIPKLVVVGDQKSGKSSVLEAISQIPFPVDEDLCTRFPTEVVQRKSYEDSITVSIQVVGLRQNCEALSGFCRKLSLEDANGLASAIQEASSLILSGAPGSSNRTNFSDDILRITITGPEKYPLTLVDLPGLFSSVTPSQSTKDLDDVDRLVRSYAAEQRNAILLVIPARSTWPNLRAPDEIRRHGVDHLGLRTLGVITTPDIPHARGEFLSHFSKSGPWTPQHG